METPNRIHPLALTALVLALLVGSAIPFGAAWAEVPTGTPIFSNPLTIDNTFFPFQPGGFKRYTGDDHGTKIESTDLYLTGTRTFRFNRRRVECRILVEEDYENGILVERSFNYFAQADDGTVYYFGEVVDKYENSVIVRHDGSWLVGGATQRSDPPGTGNALSPGLYMPGNPELGDIFKPEDLFPLVDESDEVVGVDLDVLVPLGKYDGAIRIQESSQLGPGTEYKWYAPGVGVVKVQSEGETLRLEESTLVQPADN